MAQFAKPGPVYVVRGIRIEPEEDNVGGDRVLVVLVLLVSGWMWSERNKAITECPEQAD